MTSRSRCQAPDGSRARRKCHVVAAVLVLIVGLSACAADGDGLVRFGVITDVHAHDIDSPVEGKWMTSTQSRLNAFTDGMNAWSPDFVVQLGDFINGWVVLGAEPGDPARIPGILAWADDLYGKFKGPRYHVIGNHDVYNLDKETYREILGMEATTYSFDVGAYHFVVLDLQFAEDGSDLEHVYMGVDGLLPEEDLEWLRSDLAASDAPTIVFVHQMLDGTATEWGRPTIANQEEIRSTLETDGDVIAVFQGHDHDNDHNTIGGIHYVTFEALVDQGTPTSWASVSLDPEAHTLTIVGAGEQADYVLEYSLGL